MSFEGPWKAVPPCTALLCQRTQGDSLCHGGRRAKPWRAVFDSLQGLQGLRRTSCQDSGSTAQPARDEPRNWCCSRQREVSLSHLQRLAIAFPSTCFPSPFAFKDRTRAIGSGKECSTDQDLLRLALSWARVSCHPPDLLAPSLFLGSAVKLTLCSAPHRLRSF